MSRMAKNQFVDGPVFQTLFHATWPQVLSIGLQMSLEVLSVFFIAAIDNKSLTAVGYLAGFMVLSYAVAIALGNGLSIAISPSLGQGRTAVAGSIATSALSVVCFVSVVIVLVGIFLESTIAKLLLVDAEAEAAFSIVYYYFVFGMLFKNVLYSFYGFARASGLVKSYAVANFLVAAGQPAILVLFSLGTHSGWIRPGLAAHAVGLAHAAPLLAGAVGMGRLFSMRLLEMSGKLDVERLRAEWLSSARSFATAVSPVLTVGLFTPVVMVIANALVARDGAETVAAFAVVSKFQPMLQVVMLALLGTMSAYIGQNLGAGARDRISTGFDVACGLALAWHGATAIILALNADYIAGLFVSSPRSVELIKLFLYAMPLSYAFWSASSFSIVVCNALFASKSAISVSLLRNFGVIVPAIVVGYLYSGAQGVISGMAFGNLVSGVVLWSFVRLRMPSMVTAAAIRTA